MPHAHRPFIALAEGRPRRRAAWLVCCGLALLLAAGLAAGPAQARPAKPVVVSLCPEATQLIVGLGAGSSLAGVSQRSQGLPGLPEAVQVLGWWSPEAKAVMALKPSLVIVDPEQSAIAKALRPKAPLLVFRARGLDRLGGLVADLGRRVGADAQRIERVVAGIKREAEILKHKAELIRPDQRRRTVVVLGVADQGRSLVVAGPGSWSHHLLAAAGATPVPKKGAAAQKISPAQWQRLNPQALAVCSDLKPLLAPLLASSDWREVEALAAHRVRHFPRRVLTHPSPRAAVAGQWLATGVYPDLLIKPPYMLGPNRPEDQRPVEIALGHVAGAFVSRERIDDFRHATLQLRLKQPQQVLSTLEGPLPGIRVVGNHYLPPPAWNLGHGGGLAGLKALVCGVTGLEPATSALLYTGVDMKNLVIQRASESGLEAVALVTAGVMSNAMRMGRDQGLYLEPGTINIIVLTNRRLSPRAMARALITVTEAKAGALEDLDIRSAYGPVAFAATGTGTDNIIIVEGRGARAELTGGHSKLGELMARAVRRGVTEAIARCNGITANRSVITRLHERRLAPGDVHRAAQAQGRDDGLALARRMEARLLTAQGAALAARALAVADAEQRGLAVAARGAGGLDWLVKGRGLPPALVQALAKLLAAEGGKP